MNWTTKNLGEVCNVQKGTTITQKSAIKGKIPVIGGGTQPTYYHNEANRNANCITVSGSGANAGFVNFWESPIYASDCSTVECNDGKQDPKFVYYFLLSKQNFIYSRFRKGAAQPHVYAKDIATIDFPIIPIDEQRRIAAILGKADVICRKRQQALALTEKQIQSAFIHKVGPQAKDYSNWPSFELRHLASDRKGAMRTGPFGSDLKHTEFVESGIAVLGIDNAVHNEFAWGEKRFITQQKFETLQRYQVFPGDVIITIMGTTGRSAVVPENIPEAITTKHLATISINQDMVKSEFLSNAIHRHPAVLRQILEQNKGAIMDGLNLGIIKGLKIPLPPVQDQCEFEDALSDIRDIEGKLRISLNQSKEMFMSLSQRAFGGGFLY